MSVISSNNRVSGVDETVMTSMMTTISESSPGNRQSVLPHVNRIEKLDVREAKLAGPFLDGCNVSHGIVKNYLFVQNRDVLDSEFPRYSDTGYPAG